MKRILVIAVALSFLFAGNSSAQKKQQGLEQITPELLRQHIYFLASDSLKGRNTPGPELDIAADYIANAFAASGIQKVNGSYFQDIPLCTKNLDADQCMLKIAMGQEPVSFKLRTDYTPFEMTGDTAVASSIVFAGYGITAPEYNYDDYKNIDAKGKIVLVLKHEPGEKDSLSRFDGTKETKYSQLKIKLANARQHGAIGLLVVTDPLNHILLSPQGYPWPGLSKFLPQENLAVEICGNDHEIPVVQVGEAVIKYLFGSVDSLKTIQRAIDATLIPGSFQITDATCALTTRVKTINYTAKNVVGYIEGRNAERKNEFVVVGGHYDHVGYKKNHKADEDYIFNGADDNASGTAGVMAVARAFASLDKKPERSILFILFAGEEKGLYGSQYFCNNPLFPLDKMVVMLNLDMISRNGSDSLEIEGEKQNPDLFRLLKRESGKCGLKLIAPKEDLFGRSDHYNFYRNNITAVDITSGLHKDYHTVRDNPGSIDPEKAARISQLAFRAALIIADQKTYLKIVKPN